MKSYQVYTTISIKYVMKSYQVYSTTSFFIDVKLTLSK